MMSSGGNEVIAVNEAIFHNGPPDSQYRSGLVLTCPAQRFPKVICSKLVWFTRKLSNVRLPQMSTVLRTRPTLVVRDGQNFNSPS